MHKEFIQKLTNFVEVNLANEKFGPEELAKEVGMSHSNLNRKLKSINKQNISQFIREIRLKKAKELLLNEDLTVSEISYRVGFGSPTYFNKCFHEYFGYSPGEMRNHDQQEEPAEQPVETIPQKQNRTKILIGISIILVVLISSSYFLKKSILKENIKDKSIVVLPFKYLSNDTLNQHQADGMMDVILQNLSKIKDLRVISISRTSVEQYRKSDKTAGAIGKELDVAYILEGSFQKEENQIRLIVQLIRTRDEDHVWSHNYDRSWQDIFEIQSEVAEKVASELQAVITPEEKQLIRKIPTINLTAYDFYQRGNEEYNKFRVNFRVNEFGTIKVLKKAEDFFKKALEMDSTIVPAYNGLANVCYFKNLLTANGTKDYLDSMVILTDKALFYDNQSAEAIRIKGDYYSAVAINKMDQAIKEYKRAGKLNPNDWEVYFNIGVLAFFHYKDYLIAVQNLYESINHYRGPELKYIYNLLALSFTEAGFIDKAKQCYEEELALYNDSSGYYNYYIKLFWVEYAAGNYEEALKLSEEKLNQGDPNRIHDVTLSTLSGHDKESYNYSIKLIEKTKKTGENPIAYPHRIGYSLWLAGKKSEAEYYFNQQIKNCLVRIKHDSSNSLDEGVYYDLAAAYAIKGDKEKAYQYLDEVNKRKSYSLLLVNLIKHDPLFNSLREEPRFQAIVKDMQSKYQTEHDRVGKWLAEQGML